MLRVGFVLRSTEIQPVCFRFVSPTDGVACGVAGGVGVGRRARPQPTHQRINLPSRDPGSLDPRQPPGLGGPGSPRVWGPKCVGASLSSGDSRRSGFATESRETGSRDLKGTRLAAKTWSAAAGAPGSSRVPGPKCVDTSLSLGDASVVRD